METYQFVYPAKFIPDLKKVAADVGIDCICVPEKPGNYDVTIMVSNAADLLDIGRIMGSERAYASIQVPMKEFIEIMDGKINKFLDSNPENDLK